MRIVKKYCDVFYLFNIKKERKIPEHLDKKVDRVLLDIT